MPSPTVLYVVAAIAIALLFVWVALVWKNVDVAWEATPEERARFAKAPLEGEEDPAEEEEDKGAEPPAPAKKKSKKAKPAKEASSETPAPRATRPRRRRRRPTTTRRRARLPRRTSRRIRDGSRGHARQRRVSPVLPVEIRQSASFAARSTPLTR